MPLRRVHVLVSGRVQGVFFRSSLRDVAVAQGLSGWVRNRADGRLEAEVQGPPEAVEQALKFLATGPPHARVERVQTRELKPVDDDHGFVVR